jgi:hypothetical protein
MIETYVRHSPSALNLFAASSAMFVLERVLGLKQPVGVPAHRGTAVEDGVTFGLVNPEASLVDCVNTAFLKYDTLTALSTDDRRQKYRDNIPDMVAQALTELRPYGVPSATQGFVEWKPEGLTLPIVGYFDYEFADHGIIVDLKTSERMPSAIKIPHARQVSLYVTTTSGNYQGRLAYITPKKATTYCLENVQEHLRSLHQIALRVEKFLSLSNDPEYFLSITAPDLESYFWTNPAARQLAYQLWSV